MPVFTPPDPDDVWPYATVDDLGDRFFRPLTARELEIGPVWLDAAYRKLLQRRPALEANIAAGTVSRAAVVDVLSAMVLRVFSNPEGKDRESIDDYSYGRSAVVRDGLLHVTPDELADITPAGGRRHSVRLVIYGDR